MKDSSLNFPGLVARCDRIDQAAINDPGRAETIGEHAERFGPEGFLQGHGHLAAFTQGFEYRFGVGGISIGKRERKPFMPWYDGSQPTMASPAMSTP